MSNRDVGASIVLSFLVVALAAVALNPGVQPAVKPDPPRDLAAPEPGGRSTRVGPGESPADAAALAPDPAADR